GKRHQRGKAVGDPDGDEIHRRRKGDGARQYREDRNLQHGSTSSCGANGTSGTAYGPRRDRRPRPSLRRLHRGADLVEGGADLRSEQLGRRDDADRDEGGDQAVLDGRRTGLVLHETHELGLHGSTPTLLETDTLLRLRPWHLPARPTAHAMRSQLKSG